MNYVGYISNVINIVLPIVKSWTGWNLLSVNCRSKHDLPTPNIINSFSALVEHFLQAGSVQSGRTTVTHLDVYHKNS